MSSALNLDSISMADLAVESSSTEPSGYPQIATIIAHNLEMLMVRRFRALNARNLLYLQAELVYIERRLFECEKRDPRSHYSRDYEWLMISVDGKTPAGEQWKLIQEVRAKLKEYNDVLIQQTTLAKIGKPSEYDKKLLQVWYERSKLANLPLEGDD